MFSRGILLSIPLVTWFFFVYTRTSRRVCILKNQVALGISVTAYHSKPGPRRARNHCIISMSCLLRDLRSRDGNDCIFFRDYQMIHLQNWSSVLHISLTSVHLYFKTFLGIPLVNLSCPILLVETADNTAGLAQGRLFASYDVMSRMPPRRSLNSWLVKQEQQALNERPFR